MQVELLTVTGCPHRALARGRVHAALDRVGASHVQVIEQVIDDPIGSGGGHARLADCSDRRARPFAPDADPPGSVSCREYLLERGADLDWVAT